MEEFKKITGYPDYEISNFGRVRTLARNVKYNHSVTGNKHYRFTESRLLKIYHNKRTGYKFVQLRTNGIVKNKTIHRLVAENFIPSYGLDMVNHMDGNKHNNDVDNLVWCTNEYNHEHATKTGLKAKGEDISTSKLTPRCVYAIKHLLKSGYSHSNLARIFLISRPTISLISSGKIWSHITLTGTELTIN